MPAREEASTLYNVGGWGGGYFGVTPAGRLAVRPTREGTPIDLTAVLAAARARGLRTPLLVKFPEIIASQVAELTDAFAESRKAHGYQGGYLPALPIKVNQAKEIIAQALAARPDYALEAGSRAELAIVLGSRRSGRGVILVNGHKDTGLLEMAVGASAANPDVLIVCDRFREVEKTMAVARRLGLRPRLGLRLKLSTLANGRWVHSAGDAAKFGLNYPLLHRALALLDAADARGQLRLLHFHVGSQITTVQALDRPLREAGAIYARLKRDGYALDYLDVGGGLGIDYEGTHSDSDSSVAYTVREYADAVVGELSEICRRERVAEPTIVTESGRFVMAHHAVLLLDLLDKIRNEGDPALAGLSGIPEVEELRALAKRLDRTTLVTTLHRAEAIRDRATDALVAGQRSIAEKAAVDAAYWELARAIVAHAPRRPELSEKVRAELAELTRGTDYLYIGNFSRFRSAMDSWALHQVFPVLPIQGLDRAPTDPGTLVDITCDSDGEFDQYPRSGRVLPNVELTTEGAAPEVVAVALLGAYQDVLGNYHNLLGRTHEISILTGGEAGFKVAATVTGHSVREMLAYMRYTPEELADGFAAALGAEGAVPMADGVRAELLAKFRAMLDGYSYPED